MSFYSEEITTQRYRKVKKKKTSKKSDHKHLYENILIKRAINGVNYYSSGTQCTICGKLGEERFFETAKTDCNNINKLLNNNELLEKYEGRKIINKDNWK